MTDRELLTAYQQHRSPEHFTQLVTTHINLVYSVARRHAKDAHLADDITQEVFLTLARKAPSLNPDIPLAGWLFTTTRLLSLQTLRAASRRNRHETEAAMSQEPPAQPDPTWSLIAQDIDKAVADLPPTDRDALLLRYFSGKSTIEIAAILAISEEAAKKRLQRALDSLQKLLTSRGLATTTATTAITALTLAATLTTHAVQAAPPTLASSITTALTTKTTAALATKGTLMATAKLKTALIATAAVVAITAAAGTAVYLSKHNTPTPAIIDTSAQPPTNITPVPGDFFTAYALAPDQFIASFSSVDPAIRDALYQAKNSFGNRNMKQTPRAMVIQWKDDQVSIWGTTTTDGFPLDMLLTELLNVYAIQNSSSASPGFLMSPNNNAISGDTVFRAGGTPDQYVAGLQTLLTSHFNHPVTCSLQNIPMNVVTLSGNYHFTPVENAPASTLTKHSIHFYLHNADNASSNGSADPFHFAQVISGYIGQPVVIDSPNFPQLLAYNQDNDSPQPLALQDIPLFLQNISEQTGLTATHETRPVRCLIITDAASQPADQSQPPALWKGWTLGAYPAVSPFQAVRWNNDTPEVQINDTWYQLLTLNNLPADQIITAAKSADRRWQLRFEEDLVALLAYMGREPGDTVALQLKNLQTQKTETLTDVPMTEENRKAIFDARNVTPTTPPP